MLYTVNLDENNFILSVAHTKNDNVELNLEEMELEYLSAYQLVEGKAILNEERKAELIAEEEERKRKEQEPTDLEKMEAQVYWTAMETDTLLEE